MHHQALGILTYVCDVCNPLQEYVMMININATVKEAMIMQEQQRWVNMSDAAFILRNEGYDVSLSKISRLANRRNNPIQTEIDPLDERARLVNLDELRTLFRSSKRYSSQ